MSTLCPNGERKEESVKDVMQCGKAERRREEATVSERKLEYKLMIVWDIHPKIEAKQTECCKCELLDIRKFIIVV